MEPVKRRGECVMGGQCVRILAEHAGESWRPNDPRLKLVFDAVLEGEKIKKQRCFGVADELEDGTIEHWPCIIELTGKGDARIYFGPGADPQNESINVFEKRIVVGEFFTRGTYTYRIVNIILLG